MGDADAVKSHALGLRNIRRTMPYPDAGGVEPGEDNADLTELYDKLSISGQRRWSTSSMSSADP